MNKTILFLSPLIALATASHAATISVAAGNPVQTIRLGQMSGETLTPGELVPTTSRILIGFFRSFTDNAATRTALSDPTRQVLSYIQTNFVPLGMPGAAEGYGAPSTVAITPGNGSIGGSVTSVTGVNTLTFGPGTANTETTGGIPRGTRLFLIAFDTADPSLATQVGIFSAAAGAGAGTAWLVPTNTSTITSMVLSGVDTQGEVFRGGLGSLVLAPIIPEPSSGLLALFAGCGLLSRRRR